MSQEFAIASQNETITVNGEKTMTGYTSLESTDSAIASTAIQDAAPTPVESATSQNPSPGDMATLSVPTARRCRTGIAKPPGQPEGQEGDQVPHPAAVQQLSEPATATPTAPAQEGGGRRIEQLPISQITIGPRHRKYKGDPQALIDSIAAVGLLQPIGITPQGQLVWGERRLEACKLLGWTHIAAVVDPSLQDVLRAMKVEQAENNCRLPFAPSEQAAIADEIESMERQKAVERKQAVQAKPGDKLRKGDAPSRIGGAESAPPIEEGDRGKTRDKIAAAVGTSHDTLKKIRAVVAKGTPELVEAMDRDEISVDAAAKLACLSPERQREIVGGGKKAIAAAAKSKKPQPASSQSPEALEAQKQATQKALDKAAKKHAQATAKALVPVTRRVGKLRTLASKLSQVTTSKAALIKVSRQLVEELNQLEIELRAVAVTSEATVPAAASPTAASTPTASSPAPADSGE